MAERFKSLRKTGELGGHLADLLSILSTNWQLVLSVALAIATGGIAALRSIAVTPAVYVGAGAFLVFLWTLIGICLLIDRRRPRLISAYPDYRYGLTLEAFLPVFTPENAPIRSQRGILGFAIQMRNWSPAPIKYSLESVDIQIGTRAIPRYKRNLVTGYMSRGGVKVASPQPFPAGNLKEFYGAGETKGTAEISITYGPPDGPLVRRLKFSVDMTLLFPRDGKFDQQAGVALGYTGNIVTEEDKAISDP